MSGFGLVKKSVMFRFKVGDVVRRIESDWESVKVGDIRTVSRTTFQTYGQGLMFGNDANIYDSRKFELAQEEVVALHDPVHQPFNYPETDEDKERAARDKLRAYKRGMRDWLYGTTTEGESHD